MIKKGTFISPVGYGVLHENVNLIYSLGVLPLEGISLNEDAEIHFVRTLEKKSHHSILFLDSSLFTLILGRVLRIEESYPN